MNETIKITPSAVEFKLPSGRGTRVVKVFFTGKAPRVLCYSQLGFQQIPAALFADEILSYIEKARSALSRKG